MGESVGGWWEWVKLIWHVTPQSRSSTSTHSAAAPSAAPTHPLQMHEVEAGMNKTAYKVANYTDLVRGAPHNLDEGWGLYAGEQHCPARA